MLAEYYFKIKYVSRTDNIKADTLSRRAELQGNKKPLSAILKLNKDRKVRYNHPQLAGTHEAPKNSWEQTIQKVKETDPDYKDYRGQETQLKAIYIPGDIIKEFIIKFDKGETQRYN